MWEAAGEGGRAGLEEDLLAKDLCVESDADRANSGPLCGAKLDLTIVIELKHEEEGGRTREDSDKGPEELGVEHCTRAHREVPADGTAARAQHGVGEREERKEGGPVMKHSNASVQVRRMVHTVRS